MRTGFAQQKNAPGERSISERAEPRKTLAARALRFLYVPSPRGTIHAPILALTVALYGFLVGSPVFAQHSDLDFDALDNACRSATMTKTGELFDGVNKVTANSPFSYYVENFDIVLTTYNNVTFESKYGNTSAAVVCLFQGGTIEPTDLQISFSSPGLAGYLKHPLQELLPADQRDLSQAVSLGHATSLKIIR